MADTAFDSSSVNQALNRIKNTLEYSLRENYNVTDPRVTEALLKLHGLDKSNFDFINNFETLVEKGIADGSIDTNANKCDRSITGMFIETAMPINKLVGYRYLYRKMKDLYGKKEAKRLTGLMYDLSLFLHDSTNVLKIYCYSINASKLVIEGRPFGSLPSAPPKRISSYVFALAETVHQISNHLAGAIAIGSFSLDLAHLLIYREHRTLTDLRENKEYRKYVENSLQGFVHSVNMLSRTGGTESPFTNISIFDRPKILGLIDDENMGWYFQKEDFIDGAPEAALADCGDGDWKEYVMNIILEIQEIFMKVMDEGDRLHDNRMIEFPVTSINISKKTLPDGKIVYEDPQFVDDFCNKHDVVKYNIYISESMKVASCITYNTPFYYEDENGNVCKMLYGDYVETRLKEDLGDKEAVETILDGTEKAFGRSGKMVPIVRVVKLKNPSGKLLKINFTSGDSITVTPDHKFLLRNGELTEAKDLTEGSLLYRYLEVSSIEEWESDDPVYNIEVDSEDHLYKIKLDSGLNVTTCNCCRLLSSMDMFDLGGQVDSFGGSALSLGSHRVVTVNLRRISLMCDSFDDFKDKLTTKLYEAAKILKAHKELIKDLVDRDLQPFISNGWVDLNRTFSTLGLIGYTEAARDMQKRFGEDTDYIMEMINLLNTVAEDLTRSIEGCTFNIEQIPAESNSWKSSYSDSLIFDGFVEVDGKEIPAYETF